jgi:centromeric protein E
MSSADSKSKSLPAKATPDDLKNIQVVVRIRPLNSREKSAGDRQVCRLSKKDGDEKAVVLSRPDNQNSRARARVGGARGTPGRAGTPSGRGRDGGKRKTVFRFDGAYGPKSNTDDLYEDVVQDIVRSAMQGINGTIMAYGQTSSGKTFTMTGTPDSPGIIPLATMDIFSLIHDEPDREFLLRVSMCEVYNEEVKDLLRPASVDGGVELIIREDPQRGVVVQGLVEEIVTSVDDVMALLEAGTAQRASGATQLNSESSRSHSIFRMVVESKPTSASAETVADGDPAARRASTASVSSVGSDDGDGPNAAGGGACVNVSCLTLVDLAGSERSKKTGATGARFREGNNINKSLMNLGVVIRKLGERSNSVGRHNSRSNGRGGYVPFRNSKLTRILQPSLGGNARTAMLCMVTPATSCAEDTENTLRFAKRCSQVKNAAKVNKVAVAEAMIGQHESAVSELRDALEKMEESSAAAAAEAAVAARVAAGEERQPLPAGAAGDAATLRGPRPGPGAPPGASHHGAGTESGDISAVRAALQAKLKHLSMLILRAERDDGGAAGSGALSPGSRSRRRVTWHPNQRRSARRLSVDAGRAMSGHVWGGARATPGLDARHAGRPSLAFGRPSSAYGAAGARLSLGGRASIASSSCLLGDGVDFRARQASLLREAVGALKEKLRRSEEARLQLEVDAGAAEAELEELRTQTARLRGRADALRCLSPDELAGLERSHLKALSAIAAARLGNAAARREKELMVQVEAARAEAAEERRKAAEARAGVEEAGEARAARRLSYDQLVKRHAEEMEAQRQRVLELEIKYHAVRATPQKGGATAGSQPNSRAKENIPGLRGSAVREPGDRPGPSRSSQGLARTPAALDVKAETPGAVAAEKTRPGARGDLPPSGKKTVARRLLAETKTAAGSTAKGSPLSVLFAQGVERRGAQ